jgi:thioredoxin reductase (NADPH)
MDAEHYRVRDFLTRTAQPYEWHEAGSAEADDLLQSSSSSAPGRRASLPPSTRPDGLSTLVCDRDVPGGQASYATRIENFFGFQGSMVSALVFTRLAELGVTV